MLSARTRGGRELGALKEVLKRCGQAASRFGLHVWIRLPGPAEQRDHASAPASVRAGSPVRRPADRREGISLAVPTGDRLRAADAAPGGQDGQVAAGAGNASPLGRGACRESEVARLGRRCA